MTRLFVKTSPQRKRQPRVRASTPRARRTTRRPEFHTGDPAYNRLRPISVAFAGRACWGPKDYWTRPHGGIHVLSINVRGNGVLSVNGSQYHVGSHDLMILMPENAFEYHTGPAGNWERIFVNLWPPFSSELFRQLGLQDTPVLHLPAATFSAVLGKFERILSLLRNRPRDHARLLSLLVYDILLCVAPAIPRAPSPRQLTRPLASAVAFAESHIASHINVRDLARAAGCTVAHVSRLFQAHLHVRANRWLANLKMRHAALLLDSTSLRIEEIGEAVGFPDPYHFSATFKRINGASPSAYRSRARRW